VISVTDVFKIEELIDAVLELESMDVRFDDELLQEEMTTKQSVVLKKYRFILSKILS